MSRYLACQASYVKYFQVYESDYIKTVQEQLLSYNANVGLILLMTIVNSMLTKLLNSNVLFHHYR